MIAHRPRSRHNPPSIVSGGYWTSYYHTGRDYRQPVRDAVADHLVGNHAPGPVRLLSLPGIGWRGETTVASRLGRRPLHVTALERVPAVLTEVEATRPEGLVADLYGASASDYLAGRPDREFTAVWLDFTSFIGDEVLDSLRRLPGWLAGGRVPVAVTFLACRENSEYVKTRIRRMPCDESAAVRRAKMLIPIMSAYRRLSPDVTVLRYRVTSAVGCLLAVYEPP